MARHVRRIVVVALLAGLALPSALSEAQRKAKDPARVSILVAGRDLAAGATITYDELMQREVPRELVSSSYVEASSASYVVGQKPLVPLLKNDLLRWAFFETAVAEKVAPCQRALGTSQAPAVAVARARRAALSKPAEK